MSRGVYKDEYDKLYNISNQTQLRLIPYIQYLCVNKEPIDFRKLNNTEMDILDIWLEENSIRIDSENHVSVSKEFWQTMCDVLWDAYANKINKGE